MANGQMAGALLGGIAGYLLSQMDVLRHKSFGLSGLYVAGFTVAGGVIGSVIGKGFGTQTPQTVQASADVLAWQKVPFGDVHDPSSPAYACAMAIAERAAAVVDGPWSRKCNAWRDQ